MPANAPWTKYVAIGDSFSEGLADPDPTTPNRFIGWADRLAHQLAAVAAADGAEFEYANLAIRGRKLGAILDVQLEAALLLQPDLVSLVGGGNDILRPGVDLDELAARIEFAVARIRGTGADVLLVTPTDPRGAPLIGLTGGRMAIHTANLHSIARRQQAHLTDLWGRAEFSDWGVWAEDRIHLTPRGHHLVMLATLEALGVQHALPDVELIAPREVTTGQALRSHARWARQHLGPWLNRRMTGRSSGDGLKPKLPVLTRIDASKAVPGY